MKRQVASENRTIKKIQLEFCGADETHGLNFLWFSLQQLQL